MIWTVAIISPATTGWNAGSVAKVIASSIRLRRSIAPLSTTSTPALSANRLARPGEARASCAPAHPAGALGKRVARAGEGAGDVDALARDRRRDLGRGCVLRHVPRLEP